MSNTSKFEEMLERLVNEDRQGAEELFHEIVVEKSRDIYEALLSESDDDEEVDETTDEEVDESDDEEVDEASDDEDLDESTDEELDEFQAEISPMATEGDPTDDMMGDLEMPAMGDEEGGEEESEGGAEAALDDLEAALDALKDEFAAMMGGDEADDEAGDEEGDEEEGDEEEADDEEPEEAFQYEATEKSAAEQMREYVEKIGGDQYKDFGKMGDNGAQTKSTVAGKNDMGGTTANMTKGGTTSTGEVGKGKMQGSALNDQNPKEDNAGNINVPGGKAGKAMSANGKGHGAEKKGAGETADKGAGSPLNGAPRRAK
tara:strand:+ start:1520 stop:2470 length:951 start_codon:yes stop_codon:yes gene_type:complete